MRSNLIYAAFAFLSAILPSLLNVASPTKEYFPPPDSRGGWRTLADARSIRKLAGMDLGRLDQAYEFTSRCSQNGGLLVVRHGYLVYEKYFGRAQRNVNPDMASTGKAYTSIACGIMLKEYKDKIPDGLDQKVFTEKYLPEAFPLDDPRKAEITLGQLLCMSAGYHGEGSSPGVVNGLVVPLTHENMRPLPQGLPGPPRTPRTAPQHGCPAIDPARDPARRPPRFPPGSP